MDALNCSDVPDALLKLIADKVISRMRFKGAYSNCIMVHNLLIDRFPDDVSVQNDLTITYLMLNRLKPAKDVLQRILSKWPDNGVAHVHYGFVLKMQTNYTEAVDYLRRGIRSNESGTQDARFYFHLGDALYRLGRGDEAAQVYEEGAAKNLFRSKYQRSFYNVDHLTGRPWWTLEQTSYEKFFRTLEQNWKKIRDEGMNVLNQRQSLFSKEAELLRETGDWRQFEIYHRGTMKPDCDKVPFTCRLVSSFSPAASCRQGQIKFSLMLPNTHVWPHCGPTNARLRAHLGLVIPANVSSLRVAEDSRQWEEGKVLVFDDSFEHEVWHNGTSMRLVLIVDVWHPELTAYEKKTLPTI